jgi:hypothetical protein
VGQRRALFVYILLMSLPVLWLAWALQQAGYVMPRRRRQRADAGTDLELWDRRRWPSTSRWA